MANTTASLFYTSFQGRRRLASGPLHTVALAVRRAVDRGTTESILIFDNNTGRSIDIDTRGTDEDILARYPPVVADDESIPPTSTDIPRGRGRPKLGVVAREVTLLPRHWEWLATQPGGPSVALRKLVEEARHAYGERDQSRVGQERAYHFMSAMAGDMPGFEEAIRALFANDRPKFGVLIAEWPSDIRKHAEWLAYGDEMSSPSEDGMKR
ncbi:hypothetical protein GCM10007862_12620 [Dyella lipolytica]|uniref:DUF2239 family protein n=1 Tax=Dyella lipolytica TaxID=1867835 RepID=A0ABW8IU96_9GAMM|nr:DUF2239 family protein [Dyella lipolytica]GLQ46211.1 hypothetical protein GCM10007862_12620 [Dyella lipolytica]